MKKPSKQKSQSKNFELVSIEDQTIVITGASSGIGLATARMAAERGANVVLSSRNERDLTRIVREIKRAGGEAIYVLADVSDYDDMENLRDEAVRHYGQIHTWVNNAGVSMFGPILEIPLEDEKQLFETNFWGVRHGCHVAVDAMKDSGGVIINLGSELSVRANPVQGIYSASKHAVKAYTDSIRQEAMNEEWPISFCLVQAEGINTPYNEHAINLLREGEPSLAAPVYDPDVVADAILSCAVSPQEEVYVGAFEGHVMKSSLYKQVSSHPWRAIAFVGAGIGGALLAKSFLKQQLRGKTSNPAGSGVDPTADHVAEDGDLPAMPINASLNS